MPEIIDFTNCEEGYRDYGGSDAKRSIVYNGEHYMLKFPETETRDNALATSSPNNVFSEYIGSHIVNSLGIPTHETILGLYNGEPVVACKDFCKPGEKLQEFSWYMRSMYRKDEIGRIPKYHQIYEVMKKHPLLSKICDKSIERYWDTIIADSLIGNFDRHKGNWGYLVNEANKTISLAPVYDCGSCLYPNLSRDKMNDIISDKDAINERIYKFPRLALNANTSNKEDKFGYYELLSSGFDNNCDNSLVKIAKNINMDKIYAIIDNTPMIDDTRKNFYKTMITARKEKIIDHSLYLRKENVIDIALYNNHPYLLTKQLFEQYHDSFSKDTVSEALRKSIQNLNNETVKPITFEQARAEARLLMKNDINKHNKKEHHRDDTIH